jgi:OmpA-OmpF porin, OOP family
VRETIAMRPVVKRFLALMLAMAGGACTTVLAPERTTALGPPFNEALKERYLELGSSKWQEGSWEILHFRDKARSAMLGDLVYPDRVTGVPSDAQGELIEQRERLLLFLDAGARELVPEDAAEAQVGFDCWLSGVKATHQLDSGCRETFAAALGRTEQAVLAELPASYVVPFESGSDVIGGEGLNVATAVARAVPLVEPARIEVVGHADPSGSAAANEALSLRRAENVAAALERAGVAAQLLDVQSRGTSGAPIDAALGRRVEVMFRG